MATRAQAAHERRASEANPAEDLPQVEEVPSSESEYVPPSFDEPHLYPQLLACNSKLEGPFLQCRPLIDSGCDTVMIKASYADSLGLQRRTLAKPKVYRGFQEKGKVVVSEWTIFRLVSPNRRWRSRRIFAKVVPTLYTNVILGLSALKRNLLEVRAATRAVICQRTGLDLMQFRFTDTAKTPVVVEPRPTKSQKGRKKAEVPRVHVPTPKSSVWDRINSKNAGTHSRELVGALSELVSAKVRHTAASIRQRIDELAGQQILDQMHRETMEKYRD